jgi:ribosomal protein L37AE/L43A
LRIKDEFVERHHNNFLHTTQDFIKVCPKCESNIISTRNRKTPKYRCQNCKNEFDDPNAEIVHKTCKQHRDYGRQYSNPDY